MHTASLGRAGPCAAHTQSITGRTTTCSRLHPHLHNMSEIYFRKHISRMLVYELTGLGHISLMDVSSSSAERWWWPDRYSALPSVTVSKGSLFAEHVDGVSSGPDANPDIGQIQPNLPAITDIEHLAPAKTSVFKHVTSSGSRAGKLWPLAISRTITSQPRLILWASQRLQNKERGYLGDMKR